MRNRNRNLCRMAAALGLALLAPAGAAFAQLQSGNLYGSVNDQSGAALPGVTVTLTGRVSPDVQVTDSQGKFRFVGLEPGTYSIEATLEGFSPVSYPNVTINVGRNTAVELTMSGAVAETITITSESPLLDERKISAGNTVTKLELEKIPTARDPWAVLQSTPGVLTDRINVGGNESGQQSQYVGPGAQGDQAVWALDGVMITDMSAIGSSPGYYDFDSFDEFAVSTGGSDISNVAPGVTLNMVTKRGTNEWRGSARYLLSDDSNQSNLDFDQGDLGRAGAWNTTGTTPDGAPQASFNQGNRIVSVEDWGAEAGGPIVRDRLWIWGAYAKPEIDLLTIDDFSDLTTLEESNLKLNAQLSASNSASAFGWNSDKVKIGRNAGPLRPQETTWNQSKFGPEPTTWKVEDTHVFNPNFFLTGMYSEVSGGFVLAPHIAGNTAIALLDADGVWHHNAPANVEILRPQEQARLDGSTFFNTGSLAHELRFGAGYREVVQDTLSQTISGAVEIELGDGDSEFILARDESERTKIDYTSLYAQDTLTIGSLTANLGVRYDKQGGELLSASAAANPFRPDLMPAVSFQGQDIGFEWESISPRLGLTYAIGKDRATLLRASYAHFADQLATGVGSQLHPLAVQQYAYFYGHTDGSGTLPADIGEFSHFSGNVNPITGGLLQSNAADPDMDAPLTQEVLLGVEHALRPEFVIGLQGVYRQTTDLLEFERLVFDGDGYAGGEPRPRRPGAPCRRLRAGGGRHTVGGRRAGPAPASRRHALHAPPLGAARRRLHARRVVAHQRRPRVGVHRSFPHLQQATCQPLDDARQLHALRLDLELAGEREPGSDRGAAQRPWSDAGGRRRREGHPVVGRRLGGQGQRLPRERLVVRAQRALPGGSGTCLGLQRGGQRHRPSGLPADLLRAHLPRHDSRRAVRHQRAGHRLAHRRAARRRAHGRPARGEGVRVQRVRLHHRRRPLQRAQRVERVAAQRTAGAHQLGSRAGDRQPPHPAPGSEAQPEVRGSVGSIRRPPEALRRPFSCPGGRGGRWDRRRWERDGGEIREDGWMPPVARRSAPRAPTWDGRPNERDERRFPGDQSAAARNLLRSFT